MMKTVVGCMLGLLPALALADSVNVNVYGTLRGGVEWIGKGANAKGVPAWRVVDNASVLGFKGAEDLGDAWFLLWQAEGTLEADGDADGKLNSRNTFVGLKADWGGLYLGKLDTPYKLSKSYLSKTPVDNTSAELSAVYGHGLGLNFYTRQNSSLQYQSANWSGFSFAVGYAPDEAKTADTNKTRFSLAGNFENQQCALALGYERRADESKVEAARAWSLVATWKIANSSYLAVGVERLQLDDGDALDDDDQRNVYLAGNVQLAEHWNFGGHYARAGKQGEAADTGASQISLGVRYDFTKRTDLTLYFSRINNQTKAKYKLGADNGALPQDSAGKEIAGADPQVVGLGLNHRF